MLLDSSEPLEWRTTRWRLATDVAMGMNYLHDNDVLHRDLKPGNVLTDGDGRTRLSATGPAGAAPPPGSAAPATASAGPEPAAGPAGPASAAGSSAGAASATGSTTATSTARGMQLSANHGMPPTALLTPRPSGRRRC